MRIDRAAAHGGISRASVRPWAPCRESPLYLVGPGQVAHPALGDQPTASYSLNPTMMATHPTCTMALAGLLGTQTTTFKGTVLAVFISK